MSITSHRATRLTLLSAVLLSSLALVPSAASAFGRPHGGYPHRPSSYGQTTLVLDPGTAAALTSLGIAPGVITPASSGSEGIGFPITDPLSVALCTGTITHSGGLTLTQGSTGTVVSLSEFWIELGSGTLSANVSVAGGPNDGRVKILTLDFSKAHLRYWPVLTYGPVTGTLTETAASVLDSVFGTTALTDQTVLGTATVKYTVL